MPAISGSALSTFPASIDTFGVVSNGTGVDNVIDANIWNKIEDAIFTTQTYDQGLLHFSGASAANNFKRVNVTVPVTVSASALTITTDVGLSPSQVAFFANSPFQDIDVFYAHVRSISGSSAAYTVNAYPISNSAIRVIFRNIDDSTPVPTGTYVISLTVMGV